MSYESLKCFLPLSSSKLNVQFSLRRHEVWYLTLAPFVFAFVDVAFPLLALYPFPSGIKFEFLPLVVMSVYNALGIIYCFFSVLMN